MVAESALESAARELANAMRTLGIHQEHVSDATRHLELQQAQLKDAELEVERLRGLLLRAAIGYGGRFPQ